jgi:hypothetical protein
MTGTFARHLFHGGGQGKHKYTFIGSHAEKDALQLWRRKHFVLLIMLVALAGFVVVFAIGYVENSRLRNTLLLIEYVDHLRSLVILLPTASNVILIYRTIGVGHLTLRENIAYTES